MEAGIRPSRVGRVALRRVPAGVPHAGRPAASVGVVATTAIDAVGREGRGPAPVPEEVAAGPVAVLVAVLTPTLAVRVARARAAVLGLAVEAATAKAAAAPVAGVTAEEGEAGPNEAAEGVAASSQGRAIQAAAGPSRAVILVLAAGLATVPSLAGRVEAARGALPTADAPVPSARPAVLGVATGAAMVAPVVTGRTVAAVAGSATTHDGRLVVTASMGALPDAGAAPEAGLALVALEVVAPPPVAVALTVAYTRPSTADVKAAAGAARATGAGRGTVVDLVAEGGHGRRPSHPAEVR